MTMDHGHKDPHDEQTARDEAEGKELAELHAHCQHCGWWRNIPYTMGSIDEAKEEANEIHREESNSCSNKPYR